MAGRAAWAMAAVVALGAAGCAPDTQEIGIVIGVPTGVSYSTVVPSGDTVIVQGGILGGDLVVTGDWLLGETSAHPVMDSGWSVYWGVGARVAIRDAGDNEFGVRVPGGLVYCSAPAWNGLVYVEIAPGIAFGVGFTFDAAVSVRWPF